MEKVVRTICQSCHCECGVLVQLKDNTIVDIKGDPNHPMNRGFICPKGKAQPQLLEWVGFHHPYRNVRL